MAGQTMNRWRRLWLIIKLMAAVAACVAVAIQAFLYMLDSPDAAQIHPLSIVVAGLIFGFITFGVLSLIEIVLLGLVGFFLPSTPPPPATPESDEGLSQQGPLALQSDDPAHQKNL
jgi:hypothetical protein